MHDVHRPPVPLPPGLEASPLRGGEDGLREMQESGFRPERDDPGVPGAALPYVPPLLQRIPQKVQEKKGGKTVTVVPTGWEIEYDENRPEQRSAAEEQITQLVLGHVLIPGTAVVVRSSLRPNPGVGAPPSAWSARRITIRVRRSHGP